MQHWHAEQENRGFAEHVCSALITMELWLIDVKRKSRYSFKYQVAFGSVVYFMFDWFFLLLFVCCVLLLLIIMFLLLLLLFFSVASLSGEGGGYICDIPKTP